ncbi:hypothetical protein [Paenibacillus graminis]|uniref:hypothetical protein n=1 Tax=Paenibacillus graminis TaxID=189425 RepID=UPI002DBF41E1|nr:hypothetical protein [Paenibacillus graminis]MEC0167411.1 hypothetical protein [Paenibacillus graminis]
MKDDPEQLDLFEWSGVQVSATADKAEVLNGMYNERATGRFVSFVLGRRHYEIPAKGCGLNREWQIRTKRERSI